MENIGFKFHIYDIFYMSAGIGSSAPATQMRISGIDDGWMDILYIYIYIYIKHWAVNTSSGHQIGSPCFLATSLNS